MLQLLDIALALILCRKGPTRSQCAEKKEDYREFFESLMTPDEE